VANDLNVAEFQRFAVMRHWVTSGEYRMEDVISRDQLHMNDASYHCLAHLLADSLASAALARFCRKVAFSRVLASVSH
jgi:acyl-CoA thioesterase I